MNFFKELALISAGGIIQIFLSFLITKDSISIETFIFLTLITTGLVIFGLNKLDSIPERLLVLRRKWRKKNRIFKIGILSDITWEEDNDRYHTWTDLSIEDWGKDIKKYFYGLEQKVIIENISIKDKFHTYDIILNPYGGVYPEENIETLKTLGKVLEFVENGGTFINVADTPFFYAYRQEIKGSRLSKNEQYFHPYIELPFLTNPFLNQLGIKIFQGLSLSIDLEFENSFKFLKDKDIKLTLWRLAQTEPNMKPLISYKHKGHNLTPLFLMEYGDGQFVMSLIPLYESANSNINIEFRNNFINMISKLIEKTL